MQNFEPTLKRWLTSSWRMAALGWSSWLAVILIAMLSGHFGFVVFGRYACFAVIMTGLSCCLWAGFLPQRPFLHSLALFILFGGVWCILGKLTFVLPSILHR
jgi:hypothetical protein